MALKIEDLITKRKKIKLKNKEVIFGKLTLQIEIDNDEFIKGLAEDRLSSLLSFLWDLIDNKVIYNYDKSKFVSDCLSTNDHESTGRLLQLIASEIYDESRPVVKNKKKLEELIKTQQEMGHISCYGVYYDRIAKRYDYTLDKFARLSLKDLHNLLTISGDQQYEDLSLDAALQGKKLKPRLKFDDDMTEEQDKKLDEDAKDLLARLQAEYAEKQKAKK